MWRLRPRLEVKRLPQMGHLNLRGFLLAFADLAFLDFPAPAMEEASYP